MANHELCNDKKCGLKRTCVRSTFICVPEKGQRYIKRETCKQIKEMYYPLTLDNAKYIGVVAS